MFPVAETNPEVALIFCPNTFALRLPIPPAALIVPELCMLPAVMLPVVDTGLEPRAARLATTLALPYVETISVN